MNEITIFLLGASFGGIVAAIIAVFYGMYYKEKLNAVIKINKLGFDTISKLNELEKNSLDRLHQIDQESRERYEKLIEDIEKVRPGFRQGRPKV